MKSKYIVIRNAGTMRTSDAAIVFPELMKHSDVAAAFGGRDRVLGAGFVNVYLDGEIKVHVYGHSESLKIESRPADAFLVRSALGLID